VVVVAAVIVAVVVMVLVTVLTLTLPLTLVTVAVEVTVAVVVEAAQVDAALVALLGPRRHEHAELILDWSPSQLPTKVGRATLLVLRYCVQNSEAAEDDPRRALPQLSPPLQISPLTNGTNSGVSVANSHHAASAPTLIAVSVSRLAFWSFMLSVPQLAEYSTSCWRSSEAGNAT
jgi:hypothetical protein